jgi:hypothetical protein
VPVLGAVVVVSVAVAVMVVVVVELNLFVQHIGNQLWPHVQTLQTSATTRLDMLMAPR